MAEPGKPRFSGVRQGELLSTCAVCERRPPDGMDSSGRLVCEGCRRAKGTRVVKALPKAPPPGARP